jgi:hypothetical protein
MYMTADMPTVKRMLEDDQEVPSIPVIAHEV